MRLSARAALLVFLLAAAGSPAHAQETVPVVEAELVELDIVVSDPDGRLVRDLAPEDFELFEDGKPQRLTHFLLAGKSMSAAPARDAVLEEGAPREPAGPGRHIVVVVDDLHIAPGNLEYTKEALRRFVDEFTAPDDNVALVAVSSPGGVQQLTQDRAVLKLAISRLSLREATVARSRGSQMTAGQAELILRGDRTALRLAARTLIEEPGSVYSGLSPQAAVAAPVGAGQDEEGRERAAEKEAQRQAGALLAETLRFSSATLGTIADVVRGLAPLEGRKLCLLASDGFLVGRGTYHERTRDLQSIIDAATRSGAVVYALDTRGLVTTGADAGVSATTASPGLLDRVERSSEKEFREGLQGLAADTGGFLVRGTNDLATGLRRMMEDNDAYYLLAYEPTNTKRDGRFRKIEVRLPRHPEFQVRTRKGYVAPDDRKTARAPAKPSGPPAIASLLAPRGLDEADARAALDAPIPAGGIPVQLTADYLELPPAGPQALVRAHVDLRTLRWQESDRRHRATLELVGGIYDAEGKPVGAPFGRRAELDLAPSEYKRATEEGVRYQHQLPLGPGRYQVKLIAREPERSQLGGASQWIDVPDLGEKKLALSSVFLSSSARATTGAGTEDDTFRDVHTGRRFKRGEGLYFQLYVYNALVDERGARDVVLQAQIWSGGNVIAASKPQPVTLQQRDGAPLPETNGMSLEGLAPGSYELRVVVVDRKANATTFRRVDFSVE